jgi:class 3 adenylate cyclase/tetratricopeptide (TPR) repeat protein
VRCSNCGTDNREGRKFCAHCASPLAVLCPSCGTANEPGERFCGECASPLPGPTPSVVPAGAPPSHAAATPTAERRLVSVLFADLVGFTSHSESRDPEEVRDLLSRYFDTCRQLITRYGGIVEKFIGDAVMAVWGTPVAMEDDAERAVRAALDLTEAVAALGQEVGAPDLRARAGVLTGEAAVTLGAEGQGMVAGDLVNTASRIQASAPPGQVYVGEATRRITEAAIAYEDAGLHELKGTAEPVLLWRAARVVAKVGGIARSEGLEAPFVGRGRELRMLKDLFHGSAEDSRAHLVSVVGIGGIGKSRLSWEFYKYVDGLATPVRWHRGRCLSYGEGVTYWALAEMVRTRAGILEGENADTAWPKLRQALEESIADPEERRFVEPRLAHLLGLEERTGRDREDLFGAWRLFYERLSEEMPTVMVFEDIQWADASLLDFIEHLVEWSRGHRLFVVTLTRPELLDRRPTWGAGKSSTPIYLEPLAEEAMTELLAGLVPGLPEELCDRILKHAEGVPLYAVETVRMLLDRGLLVLEGMEYRPAGPVEALEVPETLHALIAARLDGLAVEERRLVQDAAVLGKTFSHDALAALSGLPEQELDVLLGALVRKEVLSLQADPLSPERGQYGFLQDLVKRVAYETLGRKDRRGRHLAAAAFLETRWGSEQDEIVEVVASHLLEAHRAAPDAPDAPEIQARAMDMLMRAGDRAASLAAPDEARRYYEQAIELSGDPAVQADLHQRAAQAAWAALQHDESERHSRRAIQLFEEQGDTKRAAVAQAWYAGGALSGRGRLDEALGQLQQAFDVLSRDEPDETLATVTTQLARLLHFAGRAEESMEKIELALELSQVLELPQLLSHALNTRALYLGARGRMEEALVLQRHALQVALDHEIPDAAFRSYNNLVATMAKLDQHREELELAEQGLEVARRYGNRPWEWKLLADTVNPLVRLGRWDEALARVEQIEEGVNLVDEPLIASEVVAVVPALVHRGAREEAERLASSMLGAEESVDTQARTGTWWATIVLARLHGSPEEAVAAFRRSSDDLLQLGPHDFTFKDAWTEAVEAALDGGDVTGAEELLDLIGRFRPGEMSPYLRAQQARFRSRVAAARGEADGVEAGFKQAGGMFRELELPFWLAVTLLEHGEWLASQARSDAAGPLLSEARDIFERLQATPWLARLEVALVGMRVDA